MRKIFSLFIICLAISANARQITTDEAVVIASEFFNSSTNMPKNGARVNVRRVQAKETSRNIEENQPYYVFNAGDNKGFIIISGDDRAKKILGYSDTGNFDMDNIPLQLSAILDQYAEQISELSGDTTDSSWEAPSRSRSAHEAGVLLETANWGQGYPYNALCPVIDGVQAPTGCVATAMAIVMKYHSWPERGRYSHKYNIDPFGMILDEINYENTEFDYDCMNQDNTDYKARLMRTAGHSVNMAYDKDFSGTYAWLIAHSLQRYFRYSPECQYIEKSHFSDEQWTDIIVSQLNNGYPLIYSGFTEDKDGHAFVIDGYKDDMYHINWGWDGFSNGYFSLSPLNGTYIPDYNERQGMVINIIPDNSGKEYSPCWIDYGYLWREMESDPLLTVNPGTYAYPPTFEKGKQFDFYSKIINTPVDYACSFGIAVVDANENILDVIPANMVFNEGSYSLFCTINYTWNGVILSTPASIDIDLPEDYTLWVASQKQGTDKWELILGTMEAPSKCRFGDENIPLCTITHSFFNVDGVLGDPENDEENFVYSVNKTNPNESILGSGYWTKYKANNGIANVYLDGVWATNTDDVFSTSLQFNVLKDTHNIDVRYIDNDDLTDVSLTGVNEGNLKDLLTECDKIKSLTISGSLNAEDLYYIKDKCVSLQHLDLSKVTIVPWSDENGNEYPANIYPKNNFRPSEILNDNSGGSCNIWSIKSLLLPHSMKGWYSPIWHHQELGGRNMVALSMPVNHISERPEIYVDGCASSGDYSYQFVNCIVDASTDPISDVAFPDLVKKYGRLFVPKGMKDVFAKTKGWSDFKYIIEVDKPFVGKIIEKDGAQYILLSDCAVLLSVPFANFHNYFAVADKIVYNDEIYPVKYIATQSFRQRDIRHIELPENFEELDLNRFFGSQQSITLNKNLKYIIPQDDVYLVGGVLYLKNEKLLDLSAMDSYVAYTEATAPNFTTNKPASIVYVPGGTAKEYQETLKTASLINEMWKYEIDKSHGKVKIKPSIQGIKIDRVTINGISLNPRIDYLYDCNPNDVVDIVVDYTLNDCHAMTTHYDAEFNAQIPDADLSGISLIYSDKSLPVDIYNLQGICLKHNATDADIDNLTPGPYIIGNKKVWLRKK